MCTNQTEIWKGIRITQLVLKIPPTPEFLTLDKYKSNSPNQI